MTKPKRPTDLNQRAKLIVDLLTGEETEQSDQGKKKNPNAVALGKLGGKKGGEARASKLSPERRKEIARKAAEKRWGKK